MTLPDIKNFSLSELQEYFSRIGEKPFRARQVFEWIYQKNVEDFEAMTSLPEGLRLQLKKDFLLSPLELDAEQVSADGTRKFLFRLKDGEKVESVFIPATGRSTVCVSTQAGCKFACRFCASGLGGFKRQLSPSEILGQVLFARRVAFAQACSPQAKGLSHVVFMGTGEPLDNYENLLKGIRVLNAPQGVGLAARHITISTCGLVPQIERLSTERMQIELSVSLHGFDGPSRAKLMPVSRKYPFDDLIKACRVYAQTTKRQVTFEYVLIKDLTATPEAPLKLARALRGMIAKVNLIPYNPIKEFHFLPPTPREVSDFRNILQRHGIPATIRTPRGGDIAAACGQLRHERSIQK